MRPLFKRVLPASAKTLLDVIRARLLLPRCRIVGRATRRHAHLTVRPREQHFWSPHLTLDLLTEDEGHPDTLLLRGRYGPHPSVWTGFMGMYGILLMCGIGGGVYGWSQILLGEEPKALWVMPIALLLAFVLYALALNGQRVAQTQMHVLQEFLDACVDEMLEKEEHSTSQAESAGKSHD